MDFCDVDNTIPIGKEDDLSCFLILAKLLLCVSRFSIISWVHIVKQEDKKQDTTPGIIDWTFDYYVAQ